jgi:putative nucleotidyltransferase with HDIG domain
MPEPEDSSSAESQAETPLPIDQEAVVQSWARALDLRDRATSDHTLRVVALALSLARKLEFSRPDQEAIRLGALFHDIGKMGIPDSILSKNGPLDEDEWEIMKLHPLYGCAILETMVFLQPALEIVRSHHECWDGSGYPDGLQGEQIPRSARLFAVVNVWDQLCSPKPYRPSWPAAEARAYIAAQSGVRFDPLFAAAFLEMQEKLGLG